MNTPTTLRTLRALAEGVDPATGEALPPDGPYQRADVVRALFHAAELIGDPGRPAGKRSRARPAKPSAPKAGRPWTADEERRVVEAYRDGTPIAEIAREHERSRGAIHSRLLRAVVPDA